MTNRTGMRHLVLNTMEKIMRMEKAIMTNYKSYNFNCYVEQGFDAYVSLCSDVMHVISYRSIYGFAFVTN